MSSETAAASASLKPLISILHIPYTPWFLSLLNLLTFYHTTGNKSATKKEGRLGREAVQTCDGTVTFPMIGYACTKGREQKKALCRCERGGSYDEKKE